MLNLEKILEEQKVELIELKKQYPDLNAQQLSFMTNQKFYAFLADAYGWMKELTISCFYTIYIPKVIKEHSDSTCYSLDVTNSSNEEIESIINKARSSFDKPCYSNIQFHSSINKRPCDACYASEEAKYYHDWLKQLQL